MSPNLLLSLLLATDPVVPAPEVERIGAWVVEAGAESDGGLYVVMQRSLAGISGAYRLVFWRGNQRLYGSFATRRGRRQCSGGDGTIDRLAELDAGRIAAALDQHLAACGLSPRGRRAFLQRLDAPLARFSQRAGEALAATVAEAEAIANEGAEPPN